MYNTHAITLKRDLPLSAFTRGCYSKSPPRVSVFFIIMETEIWQDIPGYEGKYKASNMGRIKGIRGIMNGWNNAGYIYVNIYGKMKSVHRLVAITFLGLRENTKKICVCHKNDIGTDNRLENLFLGTQKDNISDMIKKGRRIQGNFKRKVHMIYKGKIVKEFNSILEATIYIGGTNGNIHRCCKGVLKTYLGYKWEFNNN